MSWLIESFSAAGRDITDVPLSIRSRSSVAQQPQGRLAAAAYAAKPSGADAPRPAFEGENK